MVLTEEEWGLSRWSEEHLFDWTTENHVIVWGCAGSCKAEPLDSVVYTPTGPRLMGDLQVGDRVIAHDGRTSAIIATHDVGEKAEYKVVLSDGATAYCAGDHLWEVARVSGPSWFRNHVATTEWLAGLRDPTRYSVPLCAPVYFQERAVSIPPYLMGALLGDGCFGGASGDGMLRLSAEEDDIVSECRAALSADYELAHVFESDYAVVKRSRAHGRPNKYIRALKAYGLWGKLSPDKFIPDDYLHNSVENREALLAGLLDTDGCSGTAVTFCSTSLRLAQGVQSLVRSLGGRAPITDRTTYTSLPGGIRKPGKKAYLVSIALPGDRLLFRCKRKADALLARSPSRRPVETHVFRSITPTGRTVPMKCISIDSPRGLYLTNDYIVTHNSNDHGLFAYLDWATDANDTITIMASTTKTALLQRNFEAVIRYFRLFRSKNLGFPGEESSVRTAILLSKDSLDTASVKMGVHGIAIKEGPIAEAVGRIRGAHAPYTRLLADELSQMHPAIAAPALLLNLRVGTRDSKFVGLTNIDSLDDLAGRNSEPIEGWASGVANESVERWRTAKGVVRRHDGFKSPAIVEPDGARRFPYLLNSDTLNDMIKGEGGNADSPAIWGMIRAWPKSSAGRPVVITADEARIWGLMGKATEPPRWLKPPTLVAGLDPGYGGDMCALQFAWCGLLADSTYVIWAEANTRIIPIRASARDKTVTDQILDYVLPACQSSGLKPEHLGIDDTGTQGVADAIASAWSNRIMRFSFGSRASEKSVSAFNTRLAKDVYSDTATELACLIKEFGKYRQLRDVPEVVISQATRRELRRKGGKLALQTKDDYRKETGLKSPNEFDAFIMCLGVARERLNVAPGGTEMLPEGPVEATLDLPWAPSDLDQYHNLATTYRETS
jgi:hypothetical protein